MGTLQLGHRFGQGRTEVARGELFAGEEDLGPEGLVRAFVAYAEHAFALRERYADRIQIIVGFETERLPPEDWAARMRQIRASAPFEYIVGSVHDVDGICIPGGFGVRGIEGKLGALRFARENGIPTLGLCLGLQCMVIEYARNEVGLAGASSSEFDPDTEYPVIATMAEQVEISISFARCSAVTFRPLFGL